LLDVSRGVQGNDLSRAWRQKARLLHPDKKPDTPDADRQFHQVREAFEVLSDPERRFRYDIWLNLCKSCAAECSRWQEKASAEKQAKAHVQPQAKAEHQLSDLNWLLSVIYYGAAIVCGLLSALVRQQAKAERHLSALDWLLIITYSGRAIVCGLLQRLGRIRHVRPGC